MQPDHLRERFDGSITKMALHGLTNMGPKLFHGVSLGKNIVA